jgi:hypothetical protein
MLTFFELVRMAGLCTAGVFGMVWLFNPIHATIWRLVHPGSEPWNSTEAFMLASLGFVLALCVDPIVRSLERRQERIDKLRREEACKHAWAAKGMEVPTWLIDSIRKDS